MGQYRGKSPTNLSNLFANPPHNSKTPHKSAPSCVVVPGGGLSPDGNRWISCRDGYFLPVQVLFAAVPAAFYLRLWRGRFTAGQLAFFSAFGSLEGAAASPALPGPGPPGRMDGLMQSARLAGPEQVLEYVGRYTNHRVTISNNRILDIEDGKARFQWKKRLSSRRPAEADDTDADEFIRRFLIHC